MSACGDGDCSGFRAQTFATWKRFSDLVLIWVGPKHEISGKKHPVRRKIYFRVREEVPTNFRTTRNAEGGAADSERGAPSE